MVIRGLQKESGVSHVGGKSYAVPSMCGILVSACLVKDGQNTDFPDLFNKLQAANAPRGEFIYTVTT